MYNNLKKIREIYGATQDEIAQAASVNRSTVSQWETGATKASNSKLEKLSIFYGIGPESFYELPEIDEQRRRLLIKSSEKAKNIMNSSPSNKDKASELDDLFKTTTFPVARMKFMFAMKMLLATADEGSLDDLKIAYEINIKMSQRLQAIIKIREEEEANKKNTNEQTLFDLLDSFSTSE